MREDDLGCSAANPDYDLQQSGDLAIASNATPTRLPTPKNPTRRLHALRQYLLTRDSAAADDKVAILCYRLRHEGYVQALVPCVPRKHQLLVMAESNPRNHLR